MAGDALTKDVVVGFVLVYVAKVHAQQIDEGIPPLHGLDQREQKDVRGVMVEDVSLLVQDNLASVLFVVGFADDDIPQPGEGCYILCVTIDADAVLLLRPDASATDDEPHGKHLAQTDAQNRHHADGIEYTYDIEPRKGPVAFLSLREGRGEVCHLHRNASLYQALLDRLYGRHVVHRKTGEVTERQDEAQHQNGKQRHPVETEHFLLEHQKDAWKEKQSEQDGRLDGVDEDG